MKKKISIGRVLFWEIIVFVIVFLINVLMCGGIHGISHFIDTPSILSIILIVAPALLVSGMGHDFINAFTVGKKQYSLRQLKRSAEAVQMVQRLVICGGGLSSVIAIVTLLSMLDSPSTIGPNLAVAILVVFYAIVIEFLLIPLKANVQNAITDMMDVEDEEE